MPINISKLQNAQIVELFLMELRHKGTDNADEPLIE
jgi:hypothetical protein